MKTKKGSILDHPLVRKYFLPGPCAHDPLDSAGGCCICLPERVIRAMEEPIKRGEKYLLVPHEGAIEVRDDWDKDQIGFAPWHPLYLRLPDRFQEKKECHCFVVCKGHDHLKCVQKGHCDCGCHAPAIRCAIEAKMDEIIGTSNDFRVSLNREYLSNQLRELIKLAKESEK